MIKPKILVNLKSYQRKWQIDSAGVRRFSQKAWNAIGRTGIKQAAGTELSFVFLNLKQMQQYNKNYRKKDYPTDVLSFPINEVNEENMHYLGDILICVDKASENAEAQGHSVDKELQILMLHGILHLMGYDHESDRGEMDALESKLRKIVIDSNHLIRDPKGALR
jgi:probable rRNA maturation factor